MDFTVLNILGSALLGRVQVKGFHTLHAVPIVLVVLPAIVDGRKTEVGALGFVFTEKCPDCTGLTDPHIRLVQDAILDFGNQRTSESAQVQLVTLVANKAFLRVVLIDNSASLQVGEHVTCTSIRSGKPMLTFNTNIFVSFILYAMVDVLGFAFIGIVPVSRVAFRTSGRVTHNLTKVDMSELTNGFGTIVTRDCFVPRQTLVAFI
jgi:hypothetical protein